MQYLRNSEKNKSDDFINTSAPIDSLIKRIEMFIEDNELDKADSYCEQALDIEPDNSYLWLLKLIIDNNWKIFDDKIDFNNNYKKIEESRFFKNVEKYKDKNKKISKIIKISQDNINEYFYKKAVLDFNNAKQINEFKKLLNDFNYINTYKDSAKYIENCEYEIKKINDCNLKLLADEYINSNNIKNLQKALNIYRQNEKNWNDSKEKMEVINNRIENINNCIKEDKKRFKRRFIGLILVILILWAFNMISSITHIIQKYDKATELLKNEKDLEALVIYKEIENYKDSRDKIQQIQDKIQKLDFEKKYNEALDLFNKGDFLSAYNEFNKISDFKDSAYKCNISSDLYNIKYFNTNSSEYKKSIKYFEKYKTEFELISDDEQIKKLLIGSWYHTSIFGGYKKGLGSLMELKSDGTGSKYDNEKNIKWVVKDGFLYIDNPYYKSEIRKITDGVFVLFEWADDDILAKEVLIAKDSLYANSLSIN